MQNLSELEQNESYHSLLLFFRPPLYQIKAYRDSSSSETKFLENLIGDLSKGRKRALKVSIVRQGRDKTEAVFKNFLYEDRKVNIIQKPAADTFKLDNASYVEVLCSLHQEIRNKLNP